MSIVIAEAYQAIKVVARRTGLSAHVIRIWERRYGAVEPERTGTNRRLRSDEEIERLSLLREITQCGHSIGHIAKLPTDKLRELATEARGTHGHTLRALAAAPAAPGFLDESVAAVKSLDARALEETLKRAATALGAQGLLQRVVAPLAQTREESETMKPFFSRNIDNKGRIIRGLCALVLLVGAGFGATVSVWLGIALLAAGVFVAFEAVRGWCGLRACGIKTKF